MCTHIDKASTKRWRNSLKKQGRKATVFKSLSAEVRLDVNDNITAVILRSRVYVMTWKPGVNAARGRHGVLDSCHLGCASTAIHTHTSDGAAQRLGWGKAHPRFSFEGRNYLRISIRVPLRVNINDLIGGSNGELAFTKVKLLKKDYDKAVRDAKLVAQSYIRKRRKTG